MIIIWILAAIAAVLGIVCIALALLYLNERNWRDGYNDLMQENKQLEQQRDELNRENESLHTANKRIVTEQLELHKQNTKLREDLQEAKVRIKALEMQTVEIEEVKPEPAKHTTRKKATQN